MIELIKLNQKKKKIKNQSCLDKTAHDFIEIKYYHYQKLGYYFNTYLKPLKIKF